MSAYQDFLKNKKITVESNGFNCSRHDLNHHLSDFQRDIVSWALRRGRAAIFANTGLGKTLMQLAWASAITKMTGKNVLIFAPLMVTYSIIREAEKFNVPIKFCSTTDDVDENGKIYITNYEKLHHFSMDDFVGVSLDESSILKSFDGKTRNSLIQSCKHVPYRLCATATPSPNDYSELGNHSEFLGIMSLHGMHSTFFVHDNGDTGTWRLKGHAEDSFWEWMCSWSVMIHSPADLGYDGSAYELPELEMKHAVVEVDGIVAKTLPERIQARRETIEERVNFAASITPKEGYYVWWCNLNSESKMLSSLIPGAVELTGSDSNSVKERKLRDFTDGKIRVLVTKTSIAGFGMNWQHCHQTGYVGLNDSYEQLYQSIRRFYRFGQKEKVTVDLVTSSREIQVMENLTRKENEAKRMAKAMIGKMKDISSVIIKKATLETDPYEADQQVIVPEWVKSGE